MTDGVELVDDEVPAPPAFPLPFPFDEFPLLFPFPPAVPFPFPLACELLTEVFVLVVVDDDELPLPFPPALPLPVEPVF